jgi:hypothetical protein
VQVGAWHRFATQTRLAQSFGTRQFLPEAQGVQLPPPQSRSVSSPSTAKSEQYGWQNPDELTIRGPAVAFPAGPRPHAFSAIVRYQKKVPAGGTSLKGDPDVAFTCVKRSHESTPAPRRLGSAAGTPR